MKKNTAIIVTILAWDTILNVGKTGLGDITIRGVGDGAEYTPAGAAVEVDAANLPGIYKVALTAGENNVSSNCIGGKSATANVSIIPTSWINEAEDFTATEKASITAAVPLVEDIQSGLATSAEIAAVAEDIAQLPTIAFPVMQGLVYTATAVQGQEVVIVQGDTPRIPFDFGADYTEWSAHFACKVELADTGYAIGPKTATWIDATAGRGYVDLTAAETAETDRYYAEIELRNGTQRLTAMKFRLKVREAVIKE